MLSSIDASSAGFLLCGGEGVAGLFIQNPHQDNNHQCSRVMKKDPKTEQ
jgi:hypothetical protein